MTNAYPQFSATTAQPNALPYQVPLLKIADVYADSTRANLEQLFLSSSRIVMEETMKAYMNATQACAQALAKNAVAVQQQSFNRLISANQKAVAIMGQSFADAMVAAWKPVR